MCYDTWSEIRQRKDAGGQRTSRWTSLLTAGRPGWWVTFWIPAGPAGPRGPLPAGLVFRTFTWGNGLMGCENQGLEHVSESQGGRWPSGDLVWALL